MSCGKRIEKLFPFLSAAASAALHVLSNVDEVLLS